MSSVFNKFREVSLRLVITSAKETCCWAGHGLQESWRLWISKGRFMWIYFSFTFQSQTTPGIAFSCLFVCFMPFIKRAALQIKDLPERSVICLPWPPSSEGRQRVSDGHGGDSASPQPRGRRSSRTDAEKGHRDRAGSWWITEKMQEGSLKLKAASAISTNCRYPS